MCFHAFLEIFYEDKYKFFGSVIIYDVAKQMKS